MSDKLASDLFGKEHERVKIKVRITEAYPFDRVADLKFDLKILSIREKITMVPIEDVLSHLGNKTPTPCSHLYEELIGQLPERTHPLNQSLNLNLPSAASAEEKNTNF